MRYLILLAALAGVGCSQPQEADPTPAADTSQQSVPLDVEQLAQQRNATPFDVLSDPSARYFLLNVTAVRDGTIIATTRREGSSGVSYARREIDCSKRLSRYVGEGDTLAEAQRPSENIGKMAELVDGSISDVAAKFACASR